MIAPAPVTQVSKGIRSAQIGVLVNAVLAVLKLVAGIVGNTYALIADAVESIADIFSSLVVWGGLHVAGREPDEDYPFGYGKAEALAAAVVSLMLLGAAIGIAFQAVREIREPYIAPAPWTLAVLLAVIVTKFVLARSVGAVGADIGSRAVEADASHHLSDTITSTAAFTGIAIAVWGDEGWVSADDWAALLATAVIAYNGSRMLRSALRDLMDRTPGAEVLDPVRRAAENVPGVLATEKMAVRRTGMTYRVTLHVQTDPMLPIRDAHIVAGMVKGAIRAAVPRVHSVLVHLEPYESS